MKVQMKWRWANLMVLALLMLAGCGKNREAQLVGKWKADTNSMTPPVTNPNDPQAKAMARMMEGMMKNVSLEFKADKTFEMNLPFPSSGTWSLDEANNTVVLNITKLNKMDISKSPNVKNKPLSLQIAPDTARLTMQDPANPAKKGMAFIKP